MYCILSETDYYALNAAISEALGYTPDSDTKIYNTPEPDVVDGFCVMPITVEVQEVCPELLEGVELVEILPVLTPEIQNGDDENPT